MGVAWTTVCGVGAGRPIDCLINADTTFGEKKKQNARPRVLFLCLCEPLQPSNHRLTNRRPPYMFVQTPATFSWLTN